MGKGDKKTKRGKITRGTYGVRRRRNKNKAYVAPTTKKKAAPVKAESKAKTESKAKAAAKPKKTTTKKEDKK